MADETLADILAEMREQANEPTIELLGEVFPPLLELRMLKIGPTASRRRRNAKSRNGTRSASRPCGASRSSPTSFWPRWRRPSNERA